jgi:hypothetical protein
MRNHFHGRTDLNRKRSKLFTGKRGEEGEFLVKQFVSSLYEKIVSSLGNLNRSGFRFLCRSEL